MELLLFTSLVSQLSEWYIPCTRQQAESCLFTSFKRVWLKMCADIKIMKPREDVCAT